MYLNTIDLNKMFETTRPIYVRPVWNTIIVISCSENCVDIRKALFIICLNQNFKLYQIIRVCRLNNIDCKNEWQFERGIMGNCLVFDPSAYKGFTDTKKMSLSFSLVQNESDITYGWNGYVTGYGVYYMHFR